MNLKPNMYIRTQEGKIDKVIEINTEDFDQTVVRLASYPIGMYQGMFEYKKASHNIIDLIEVGDYVNGYKVVDFSVTYFNGIDRRKEPKRIGLKVVNGKFDYENYIEVDDIKSIVTKEQFESMEYKVC